MSRWTVEKTGDILTLDDALSVPGHLAEVVKDATGPALPGPGVLPAGPLCWRIVGRHYVLEALGDPAKALAAAAKGGWREVPA
jgi:hypothetical protein